MLHFHHTGLLVKDIDSALIHYRQLFGEDNISEIYDISSQGVMVCFVKNGTDSYLELVQSNSENSVVNGMLKKRISYYHLAYKVDEIEKAILVLEQLNYKSLGIFKSEAFEMKKCCFLYTPEAHLIELIEK